MAQIIGKCGAWNLREIHGSNIINSAELPIFNTNLLNGTVIGSLTGANSGDQLTCEHCQEEYQVNLK